MSAERSYACTYAANAGYIYAYRALFCGCARDLVVCFSMTKTRSNSDQVGPRKVVPTGSQGTIRHKCPVHIHAAGAQIKFD